MAKDFNKCCAEYVKDIWEKHGGSMNIVRHETHCPVCNHYIGITQTSEEQAEDFLSRFGLQYVKVI